MSRLLKVLWLEDSDDDVVLLNRAIRAVAAPIRLWRVGDGREGCDFLLGNGKYHDREEYPLPDVIISDLKMPNMTGGEFVGWLRKQPAFTKTPVLLLSTSGLVRDLDLVVQNGASRYWMKPTALERWNATLSEMMEYARQALRLG